MTRPRRHSLKVVVQYLWSSNAQPSVYRLVAYDDREIYRPAEFSSLDDLLQVFRTAVANFDASALSNMKTTQQTHIVFSEVMELDDTQLSVLGLVDKN